ncbi:hypothetical protein NPIL_38041 [Nephila pilipes]|uniref:Uncharacterized protein n=1 Tax=Nephila pilipes TaxID=299642 RepID=A0A8X6PLK7_NEPPI|nr:hypothetical protein NPIL_38041 [Nephila pilipes]
MTRRVVRNAVKFNRGIPWNEGLVRSSAKGCRPAQCRLRSQPRKNPSLATVRGERNFVRQHKKKLSRRLDRRMRSGLHDATQRCPSKPFP